MYAYFLKTRLEASIRLEGAINVGIYLMYVHACTCTCTYITYRQWVVCDIQLSGQVEGSKAKWQQVWNTRPNQLYLSSSQDDPQSGTEGVEREYLTGTEWGLTETPLFPGMMYATVSRSKSSPCSHFGLLFPTCHHLALEPIASERFYLRAHPVVVFSLSQFHFSSVFLPWYSCCFFQACFPSFTTFKSWQTKHEAFSSFTVHLIFPCWHHAFQHTDRPTRLAFSLYAFSDARALAW